MQNDGSGAREPGLSGFLDDESLTPGQKRRLAVFQSVESAVCERIEEVCGSGEVEITDVAVLVIAPAAHDLFFDEDVERGVSVVLGHRNRVEEFLRATLPPAEDAPSDPYADLQQPAPERCVRVLVIDDESLTVMSYGTFVTVEMDPTKRAVA
jgi:hypothetical protein